MQTTFAIVLAFIGGPLELERCGASHVPPVFTLRLFTSPTESVNHVYDSLAAQNDHGEHLYLYRGHRGQREGPRR